MANNILINDVAHLFRISAGAIRFYERKNIITPARDGENGYRYFTQDDIRRLSSCRILSSMGLSLNEIADIFQNSSEEKISEHLKAKKTELQTIIKDASDALESIEYREQADELIKAHINRFFIQNSPHLYFSFHSEFDVLSRDTINSPFWDYLAKNHAAFHCSTLISPNIAGDSHLDEKMRRGYSIECHRAERIGLQLDDSIMDLKPRRCAYTVIHAEPIISYDHLWPAYDWMKTCGFKLTGSIVCRTIKVSFNKGVDSRFYEVWLPID